MAVKWYKRNAKSKNKYVKSELFKLLEKSIMSNENIDLKEKLSVYINFFKHVKTGSLSYYRRYSVLNFNGRAVLRHFKLHRLLCKKWASAGMLTGLRKSSF